MWLSKPVYEGLPYCYLGASLAVAVGGFFIESWYWAEICLGGGIVGFVAGLVLLLKRRGYRASRSRLDFDQIDETR